MIYERQQRFTPADAQEMVRGFLQAFAAVGTSVKPVAILQHTLNSSCIGMPVDEKDPIIRYKQSNATIGAVSEGAAQFCSSY